MRKKALLLILLFMMTGCSVVRINTKSIDNITDVILSKDNTLYNQVGKGYKYYLPKGVSYIDSVGLNDRLYSNGTYYYLYMDVVGFYYTTNHTSTKENAYYFKELDINNKKGYLKITQQEKKYYIEFFYNYAKIEALVTKNQINDVVLNASYILSTVKFNNNVIKLMLDDDFLINKEEKYDLFESKQENNNFLKYEIEE